MRRISFHPSVQADAEVQKVVIDEQVSGCGSETSWRCSNYYRALEQVEALSERIRVLQ